MSIIHEALKKTQQNMSSQNNAAPLEASAQTPLNAAAASNPSVIKTSQYTIWSIISLSAGFIAIFILTVSLIKTYAPALVPNFAAPNAEAPVERPILPAAKPKPAPKQTLQLQGIMSQEGSRIALINNQIYEQGAEIKGIKIQQINANDIVVLYPDGMEETIKVGK